MTRQKVTDPALLAQLGESPRQKVTDPNLLAQLNGSEEEDAAAYLDNLPPPEGSHPFRDILIGLTNAGKNIHNMPHDSAQGLEGSLGQLGQSFEGLPIPKTNNQQFKLSEHLPHDVNNYAEAFGQKGEGTMLDKFIQKGLEHAPEIYGGVKLLSKLPITSYPGTKALSQVQKAIQERGVGKMKVPEHIFKDIKDNKFLRNTQANRNLLEEAKKGNYKDLFALQSDLGGLERSHGRDMFNAANRQFGKDIGTTRQDLLSAMKSELSKLGHEDLAELLSHGQNRYRQFMKFRPYRNAALGLGLASMPGYNLLKKLIP